MSSEWLKIVYLSIVALCGVIMASPEIWLRRNAVLDPDVGFRMEWGNGEGEEIYIRLEVRALGYVAIGFSKDGTMVDSDFVVGWVSDGQVYLQDRHAEGNQMPELDLQQDYELISGCENDTHTTLFFKRKWNTCDKQDFTLEYDNTISVIHAYSDVDPVDEIRLPLRGSFSKGWTNFLLLQPEIPRAKDVQTWEMLTDTISVSPEWHTLYWCKLFKVSEVDKKHHITTLEPIILDGHQGGYVHHVVVYECAKPNPKLYDPHLYVDGYDCNNPKSPSFTKECDGFGMTWAIGGEAWELPEHIGLPLFPDTYLMLQIHFDNINRDTGTPGRSGFRLHYTPNLRRYDAGIMIIGNEVRNSIAAPPGIKNFVISGHSNPDCIDPFMPPEGVMINSGILHTHMIGRSIIYRHFRNSVELPPIAHNKHYNNLYQQPSVFREEVLLLPGDQMTVECTYDSTSRTKTTMGGNSTIEEMCAVVVIYYPRIEGCYGSRSLISKRKAAVLVGSEELIRLASSTPNYDKTFQDFMINYDWNQTAIRRFEKGLRSAYQDTYCILGTGIRNTVKSKISYPRGLQKYVAQSYCAN